MLSRWDRSRVWAEPCLLSMATSKLSGVVEQWLSAAERLYGPYMWGRYVLEHRGALACHKRGQRANPYIHILPRSNWGGGLV